MGHTAPVAIADAVAELSRVSDPDMTYLAGVMIDLLQEGELHAFRDQHGELRFTATRRGAAELNARLQ